VPSSRPEIVSVSPRDQVEPSNSADPAGQEPAEPLLRPPIA
jgi:hypothetical protein